MRNAKRAREAGLIAAVVVILAIAYTLFASPGIGAMDDGAYASVLDSLGLAYPEGSDQLTMYADRVVADRFVYENYDFFSLLTPGTPAIAYPAALVRALTRPFGLDFSVRLLACAYMALIGWGAYLMIGGLYRRTAVGAVAAGAGLCLLFMQANLTGYLNSLYETGAAMAFFVLYAGFLTRALCAPRRAGTRYAVGVILSGALLLCAHAQLIVLAPFVAVGMAMAIAHCCPEGRRRAAHAAICAVALLYAGLGAGTAFANSADIHADASNYLAVFQGYLPSSDDPEGALNALGLDESYLADAGRSYYEPSENFAHDPRSEAEQTALLEKITLERRLALCLARPQIVSQRIDSLKTHLYDAFNERLITTDGNLRFIRPSPFVLLDLVCYKGDFAPQSLRMLISGALCLLLSFLMGKGSGGRKLLISLSALLMGLALYLPGDIVLTGGVNIDRNKALFFFFGWAAFFSAVAVLLCGVQRVGAWLGETGARLAPPEPAAEANARAAGGWLARVRFTRGQLVGASAAASVLIVCMLLLPKIHVGGVNNGDFGRMMEQLDLYWTQELLDHSEDQLATKVVEEYDYREPFHAERLTPADPTYSLIFPSLIARAVSAVTGAPFSTLTVAFVMLLMTIAGILLIVRDLYPLLGRAAALIAVGLIAMLLGENYVAWYNSLFGESSISTGLIWTVACALHLCLMERGAKRSWLWLLLLAMGVRFLCCAKAQMALALPVGLILVAVLAWYHHPRGLLKGGAYLLCAALLAGWISWDTYGVYKKNAGVSDQQTVWSSVFYGALMISDDPLAAMDELGIDRAMAPDIGKNAYYDEDEYVYALNSPEAEEKFYSRVNTLTMVKYYLRHPKDLLKMLDRAARESVTLHTGFMAYTGDLYEGASGLYRFNLWRDIRPLTACRAFWQYVLLYGAAVAYCLRLLQRKGSPPRTKLMTTLYLCVMLIGVFQYPLSVIGNGFADNNKQLYGFMLCHDLLTLTTITLGVRRLYRYVRRDAARLPAEGEGIRP